MSICEVRANNKVANLTETNFPQNIYYSIYTLPFL